MPTFDETLREYALRVAGRDRSWKTRGLCRTSGYSGAFLALEDETFVDDDGVEINGYQAQKRVVEQFCDVCPVQWECARWGLEVHEEVGVYAMTARERWWLFNTYGDASLGIIDQARVDGVAVHVAVHRVHYPPMRAAV